MVTIASISWRLHDGHICSVTKSRYEPVMTHSSVLACTYLQLREFKLCSQTVQRCMGVMTTQPKCNAASMNAADNNIKMAGTLRCREHQMLQT